MYHKYTRLSFLIFFLTSFVSCITNPYAVTNRSYKKQVKALARTIKNTPVQPPGADSLSMGDYWVGTTNFNLRKPNFVIIHHTAQDSTAQTLKTFTRPQTQVSAHYVIGRDGKIYHMLNDYLRAWHGGAAKWGNTTDINSTSIGIELDNNGLEPFAEAQINSLLLVLARLKKTYNIPTANFIGHSDIAPTRKNDPSPIFPWKKLAEKGYGFWYDEAILENLLIDSLTADSTINLPNLPQSGMQPLITSTLTSDSLALTNGVPLNFNPKEALRIIGYDTSNLDAAIRAFKHHFIQTDINAVLTRRDLLVLYNLYQKYF
ncbi:N-acetylmuramoyl-L-alanine amidase [Adhaeribacter rhizoryzae]|uniref:N-acetylmuramoyl-L-alanine amidase n=1 Tax=Adhaeribacter rhizoryzae TaxID=2607907 RepID=A0A5M6D6Z3_9BACT|nr:N-acetylmuramoyl-L-alanine amidase [Adhaeribacter rhizoryzae]KAA5541609.1 N-acetylmuramoyl-L-alanine amidase [Adhaeribacter rhizoryzae]